MPTSDQSYLIHRLRTARERKSRGMLYDNAGSPRAYCAVAVIMRAAQERGWPGTLHQSWMRSAFDFFALPVSPLSIALISDDGWTFYEVADVIKHELRKAHHNDHADG